MVRVVMARVVMARVALFGQVGSGAVALVLGGSHRGLVGHTVGGVGGRGCHPICHSQDDGGRATCGRGRGQRPSQSLALFAQHPVDRQQTGPIGRQGEGGGDEREIELITLFVGPQAVLQMDLLDGHGHRPHDHGRSQRAEEPESGQPPADGLAQGHGPSVVLGRVHAETFHHLLGAVEAWPTKTAVQLLEPVPHEQAADDAPQNKLVQCHVSCLSFRLFARTWNPGRTKPCSTLPGEVS